MAKAKKKKNKKKKPKKTKKQNKKPPKTNPLILKKDFAFSETDFFQNFYPSINEVKLPCQMEIMPWMCLSKYNLKCISHFYA